MYKLLHLLFLFPIMAMNAQIHEVGVFVGVSNFVGDVGRTDYIYPNKPAIGITYKWNKSPRHSYRFSYTQTNLRGNDVVSKEARRYLRGYSFDNSIKEVSLGLEFNFFNFDLHKSETKITPYIFSGINYTIYDGLFFVNSKTKYDSNHGTISIPITIGVKTNINRFLILGFEIGPRYTFADDIDGSNPTNKNLKQFRLGFGNINNNDWYVFSGLTLTYTFGEKPCYCAE